jgi:hypothetical protein
MVCLAGCAPTGAVLSPRDIETYGRHQFQADASRTFEAALGALRSEGYSIAFAQRETGMIKTGRKVMGYVYPTRYRGVPASRQYQLSVVPIGPASSGATAIPYLFVGEENVSGADSWDVNAERQLWAALFGEMEQMLSAPKVIQTPGPGGL